MSPDELVAAARAWRDDDPDPGDRAELDGLIAAGDIDELRDRFGARLEFGTAGLRGRLGAGPNRMNRALVRRAAAGLARYLDQRRTASAGIVIGYDARHQSDLFAADTAAVVAGAGIAAWLLPGPLPTPLLAFAIRDRHAAAGVMVTASHNPPDYNGYKVYLGDGAQIVPPVDAEISAAIAAVGTLAVVPVAPAGHPLIDRLGEDLVSRYVSAAAALSLIPSARDVHIVYTPMHGVGGSVMRRLLTAAGFRHVEVVGAQAEPDPDFPTVAFPNPEEPGALDLAVAQAGRTGADLVLANDPDADRLGAAVPERDRATGAWRVLRGDEIGVLLADHVLRHTAGDDRLVVTTIVSSSLLARMAAAAGVHYAHTLTGFKWVARVADDRPDLRFVFGYEEALGYCAGTLVRDKDGMTAGLLLAELVAALKAEGRTVHDRLAELAVEHGAHVNEQWSITVDTADGPDRIRALMRRLRSDPPARLGELAVSGVDDLLTGGELPPTDALVLHVAGSDRSGPCRVTLRPSGTEPKLKIYLEAVEPVTGGDVAAARARAAGTVATLRAALAAATGLASGGR